MAEASKAAPVGVLGYYPPPFHGQAVMTRRLADLLAPVRAVQRIDLSPGAGIRLPVVRRIRHYVGLKRQVERALEADSGPVLWPAISPAGLGHLRDRLVVLPAVPTRRPLVAIVHWGDFDRVFRALSTRRSAARLVKRVHRFVFLNEGLAERCAAFIPAEKRAVIPNTVEPSFVFEPNALAAARAERSARRAHATEPLRVLFLSNMIATKGYDDLFVAAIRLKEAGRPVRVSFVGAWPSESARSGFLHAAADHGLLDTIDVPGVVSDPRQLQRLLTNHDVLALPTYYPTEAQPLVIIEALAAGTPVVSTAHAGIPDMVSDDVESFLVPPRRPEALAAALERMRDASTWERLSLAASKRFDTQFHPHAVRERWLALLDDVT